MIVKSSALENFDLNKNKFLLLHGRNDGLKSELVDKITGGKNINYDEKEILNNEDNFIENLLSNSLFDEQKIIIVKRATDKLINIFNKIDNKNLGDTILILNSENLEKKSKLRSLFEKSKKYVCAAFYPDNEQTLSKLVMNFCKEKKISISFSNINLIVNKCMGDRQTLYNELNKIENFCKNGKKITLSDLEKLINLSENHTISELINHCMAKNKKKINYILNENNFTSEDSVMITRTFLNKSKRVLQLANEFKKNKNIELTISNAKPPIFWKDKEIVREQILKWSPEKIKKLIYKINNLELFVKKDLNNSTYIITDFIIDQAST